MVEGKISENVLKRSILKEIKVKSDKMITGAAFGEDCAILNCSDNERMGVAVSEGIGSDGAKIALIKAANDLAANGIAVKYVTVSLMISPECEEGEIKEVEKAVNDECAVLGAAIIGGHSEVSPMIGKPILSEQENGNDDDRNTGGIIVSITAFGEPFIKDDLAEKSLDKKNIKPGNAILAAKSIALEGAYRIFKEKKDEISAHFGRNFSDFFDLSIEDFSVSKEARAASLLNATAMKNVSEHGIFGALWELASAAGCGLKADIKAIPVRQEIIEVCNFYDINPYALKSSGMLLIVCEDADDMIEKLKGEGIEAVKIGEFTSDNDKVIVNGEDVRYIDKIKQDEIFKVL